MAKVKEVVADALGDILAQGAEEPIEPVDGMLAMRYLNDMMSMWDARGISLGFTRVSSLGHAVTVAEGALYGIKKLLAISLAPQFKAEVTATLLKEAKMGWEAILSLISGIDQMSFPSELPLGSGHYSGPGCDKFYPALSEAILSEASGFISVEDDT